MNVRRTAVAALPAALAAAVVVLAAPNAQARSAERFDRSAFDTAPVVTASGYTMAGATAGELGGYLSLSVQAADGSVPAQGECETADVRAVLTVAPGEAFAITTTGELCSHFIDGSPTLDAAFGAKQVTYTGTHKGARVTDGTIAFHNGFPGAQGSVGLSVRW
jgi:hypothetical protein